MHLIVLNILLKEHSIRRHTHTHGKKTTLIYQKYWVSLSRKFWQNKAITGVSYTKQNFNSSKVISGWQTTSSYSICYKAWNAAAWSNGKLQIKFTLRKRCDSQHIAWKKQRTQNNRDWKKCSVGCSTRLQVKIKKWNHISSYSVVQHLN